MHIATHVHTWSNVLTIVLALLFSNNNVYNKK